MAGLMEISEMKPLYFLIIVEIFSLIVYFKIKNKNTEILKKGLSIFLCFQILFTGWILVRSVVAGKQISDYSKFIDEVVGENWNFAYDYSNDKTVQSVLSNGDLEQNYKFYKYYSDNVDEWYSFYSYLPTEVNNKKVELSFVNIQYNQIINIKTEEGRTFSDDDFKMTENSGTKEIPVLIGNMLSDSYEAGKTYTIRLNNKEMICKVIGIIEKNFKIPDVLVPPDYYDLSYSLVIPVSDYVVKNFYEISDYDMLFFNSCFVADRLTQDEIKKQGDDINFFEFKFENLRTYNGDMSEKLKTTALCLTILYGLLTVCPLYRFIKICRNHTIRENKGDTDTM